MISYRHHVVSLVAVFLALAVGVVLGGGPLSELGRDDSATTVSATTKAVKRSASFGDEFASASAATLYAGRLRDHAVSILSMPGADGRTVSALAAQVEAAGGTVAGTYDAQPVLLNAAHKSLVDTLGSQLMSQLGDGAVSSDAATYDRIGQLIGLAMASTKESVPTVRSVRQSLAGAELLKSPDSAVRTPLVLVVLGDSRGDDVDDAILSGVLSGLAAKATGVVVAGDTASGVDGELRALRGEPVADDVATVDGADAPLGQVTTVLALARSLDVQGGAFGASGADGAVPLG